MGQPKAEHYTYADYLTWPDEVRYELLDGVAYAMSPAPTRTHQILVGELFFQVTNALKGTSCQPFVAPFDVRLPNANEAKTHEANAHETDDQIDTVVQPDVLVVCDPSKIDERGVHGAPDWVAEVLSPRSAKNDLIIKLAAYERAGVAEYWLLHPLERLVTVYKLDKGRYGRPYIGEMEGTLPIGVLPNVTIDFALFPD